MYQLVYLSTATQLFTDLDLDDILTSSRRNNLLTGITGVLLYHEGVVLQVLEGKQQDVQQLMEHICSDPRHHGVYLIMEGQTGHRYFGDWTMGFRRLSDKDWSQVEGYVSIGTITAAAADSSRPDHHDLLTFISSFCRLNFGDQQL